MKMKITPKIASYALLLLEPFIILYMAYITYIVLAGDKYNSTDKSIIIISLIVSLFVFVPSIMKSFKKIRA